MKEIDMTVEYVGRKIHVLVSEPTNLSSDYFIRQTQPFIPLENNLLTYESNFGFTWPAEPVHQSFVAQVAQELTRRMGERSMDGLINKG